MDAKEASKLMNNTHYFQLATDSSNKKRALLCFDNKDAAKLLSGLSNDALLSFSNPFKQGERIYFTPDFHMDIGNCTHLLSTAYTEGLPEAALCIILRNVLRALAYLHTKGVIHRAIRAENIFLHSDGQVRLALTQHALRISESPRWIGQADRVHNFSGLEDVFAWSAPEIFRQDLHGYGIQSDIYTFGIAICELANGYAPFVEMEPLQILYEKLRGTAPLLLSSDNSEMKRNFSPELHEMVNDTLKNEPDERPLAVQLLQKYGDFLGRSEDLSQALPLANIKTSQ